MWIFLLCFVFFFKQKTAYEMCISDWSSDVCSSDLIALIDALPERRRRIVRMRKLDGYSQREISQQLGVSESIVENEIHQGVRAVLRAWRDGEARAEAKIGSASCRERVVSVRVDLGGRRLIKKKTYRKELKYL